MYVDKNIKDNIITEPNESVELEKIEVNFNSMSEL
jgi:hypothetical protein